MKKLLVPLMLLGLLLGAETALADRDDRRGYDRGHDRDYRSSYHNNHNNKGRAWGRRDAQRGWDRGRWHNDRRGQRDSDVRISLNFGSVLPHRHSIFGSGFGSSWNKPARHYNKRQPVVIYQNTYINRSTPIVSYPSTSGSSLLRDVNGRCYERSTDYRGVETRIELPASACNF